MKPFAFGEQSEPFTQIDSRDSLTERHFKGCKILKKQIKYIGYIELKGDYNGSYACSKNIADAHGRRNP